MKVMKNKSSYFIGIILQCNIISIIHFILHVRILSRLVLYFNKVIQVIYILHLYLRLARRREYKYNLSIERE
jgi:hypothetical protein